jgi:hypothetical protein
MPHKILGRLIRVVALLTIGLASTLPAQAQQGASSLAIAAGVTARNATVVGVSQGGARAGEIRKVDSLRWIEFDAAGTAVFKYDEVKRDDTSISLVDRTRGVTLQIDMRTKKVMSTDTASRRRELLYDIQSASAEPVKVREAGAYFQESGRQAGPLTTRDRASGATQPVREEIPPFCWTDVFTRPAGTIPGRIADCPMGYSLTGGACKRAADSVAAPSRAADCPAGYAASGNACERPAATKANTNTRAADCPDGFTNTGGECFRLSAPNPLPASSMTCKGGETKIEGRCYRACEAGFNSSGTNCVRPASTLGADNLSCKAGYQKNAKGRCIAECASGYTNTGEACTRAADTVGVEAMVCKTGETRTGGRCFPANGKCASGEVLQGGLCFAACAAGSEGFGTACVASAPKSWAQCGMGAAKDAAACAALALDQVATVRQLALMFGMNGVAGATPQARSAALQKKYKELTDAYAKAKDLPKFKKARDDWDQAKGETSLPMEKITAAGNEDDMLRYASQLVAITEPAGPFETAAYPKCSKLFPAK